jgi:hypothetical protein
MEDPLRLAFNLEVNVTPHKAFGFFDLFAYLSPAGESVPLIGQQLL